MSNMIFHGTDIGVYRANTRVYKKHGISRNVLYHSSSIRWIIPEPCARANANYDVFVRFQRFWRLKESFTSIRRSFTKDQNRRAKTKLRNLFTKKPEKLKQCYSVLSLFTKYLTSSVY